MASYFFQFSHIYLFFLAQVGESEEEASDSSSSTVGDEDKEFSANEEDG